MSTAASDIIVVDTNIVSFFVKGDTRAALYHRHLDGRLQIIAAQTRAELELWTLIRNWGQRRRTALHAYLKISFSQKLMSLFVCIGLMCKPMRVNLVIHFHL